ncbi:MAG: carboxylating nicotinate-nucleotide diphosphorylase [Phycisphaerae bacterium]
MKNDDQTQFSAVTKAMIDLAFREDLGDRGDVTANLLESPKGSFTARVVAREYGVLSGIPVADAVLLGYARWLDSSSSPSQPARFFVFSPLRHDSTRVKRDEAVLELSGLRTDILALERTLLNFLGRMSGVATLTREYVDAARVANPNVKVLDTRKTIPGWRELDKYAVRCGGGTNHRNGLYDAILIKDNHLAGVPVGELRAFLTKILKNAPSDPKPKFIEVEVDNLEQFRAIIGMPEIDILLLDNFSLHETRAAVAMRNDMTDAKSTLLESSGGVTLDTIADIAATGVDRISVGALTHSAVNFDFGLDAVEGDEG